MCCNEHLCLSCVQSDLKLTLEKRLVLEYVSNEAVRFLKTGLPVVHVIRKIQSVQQNI